MRLNKTTIKDLENKQPTLSYLLDNDLAKVGDVYELLEILENSLDIYIFDELQGFLNSRGYIMVYDEGCIIKYNKK